MERLRSTWLALMGGALLMALSVSAALGAPPSGTEGPRGQSVAAFVHELIFGSEDTDADGIADEDEDAHDACVSEEASDKTDETDADGHHGDVVSLAAQETCRATEPDEVTDLDEQEEDSERQVPEEFANHGDCVSQATQDPEGFEDSEAKNFGAWVSMHARFVCWGLDVPEDETDEEPADEPTDEEGDTEEASAKEQRKAERAAARAERKAEREAAMATRHANRGGGNGNDPGNGNARGGGRP